MRENPRRCSPLKSSPSRILELAITRDDQADRRQASAHFRCTKRGRKRERETRVWTGNRRQTIPSLATFALAPHLPHSPESPASYPWPGFERGFVVFRGRSQWSKVATERPFVFTVRAFPPLSLSPFCCPSGCWTPPPLLVLPFRLPRVSSPSRVIY